MPLIEPPGWQIQGDPEKRSPDPEQQSVRHELQRLDHARSPRDEALALPQPATNWPGLSAAVNLRLDPFERMGLSTASGGSLEFADFFIHEFWRFVYVQPEIARIAQTAIEFPPMQKGATFNMEAVKQQIEAAQKRLHSQ